ncbi:MAG: prolyl oligopeptidase family serine peptidase [Alphaproteobacteria bacterium]
MTPSLSGPRQAPASGGTPEALVILLHGYGADGNDLIGLSPYLARVLPGAAFVSPHAPEACEMSPMGRQWFSLGAYDPERMRRDPAFREQARGAMLEGALKVAPTLDAFIDAELARAGLDESRLALVGFSQGTMMSLQVGLRRRRPAACIVGFSGSLVGAERLKREITVRPPILLVHGDTDDVVPFASLFEAVAGLGAAQLSVLWHVSRGAGHTIAPDGLDLACQFLAEALGRHP